jgi:hypothetical protein
MEETATDTTRPHPSARTTAPETIGIIVAILALVGVLFAMNLANDRRPARRRPRHDGDGKPDHGDERH